MRFRQIEHFFRKINSYNINFGQHPTELNWNLRSARTKIQNSSTSGTTGSD